MGTAPVLRLSTDEYLAIDRAAELESEYHDGEVIPMSAVSWTHSQLSGRIYRRFEERLEDGPCKIGVAPIRIRISSTKYVCPDVAVICGQPAFTDEHADTITNPRVIVEVLSPSTSDYDRGGKFALYRELASFEEYLLVFQDRVRVETYRKTAEGWLLRSFDGLEAVVTLHSLGISIPLAEIYKGILER